MDLFLLESNNSFMLSFLFASGQKRRGFDGQMEALRNQFSDPT